MTLTGLDSQEEPGFLSLLSQETRKRSQSPIFLTWTLKMTARVTQISERVLEIIEDAVKIEFEFLTKAMPVTLVGMKSTIDNSCLGFYIGKLKTYVISNIVFFVLVTLC